MVVWRPSRPQNSIYLLTFFNHQCGKSQQSRSLGSYRRNRRFRRSSPAKHRRDSIVEASDRVSHWSTDFPPQQLSLLEELFPEEYEDTAGKDPTSTRYEQVPRLPLSGIEDPDGAIPGGALHSSLMVKKAVAEAFRKQQLAVLLLEVASKSLIERDFRRIAPRGKHIDEWTGPGDILKVIPARNSITFEQTGHYFILFPNPAYARTYQNHVIHLQRLAKIYTPNSIDSALPVQPGVIIEGEDVYPLLQEYALCPPSQKIKLKLLHPNYHPNTVTGRLLSHRGYAQLIDNEDKSGKSVLFWVNGTRPTTLLIREAIGADGRQRGHAWNVSIVKLDLPMHGATEATISEAGEGYNIDDWNAQRHQPLKWLLSFPTESEARRFIRAWHRTPFPHEDSGSSNIANAEFLW